MKNQENRLKEAAELRRQAEETLQEKMARAPENLDALSPAEFQRLLHELRVHQIELEMQNEELRRTQDKLDAERALYFDLWDLAPVGYVSASETGLILEANLTAVSLLGVPRTLLARRPFSKFLLKEDQDSFYLHQRRLLETGEPQSCELRMKNDDNTSCVGWVHLEAILTQDEAGASAEYRGPDERRKSPRQLIRIVLSDISERKQAEEVLRESEAKHKSMISNISDVIAIMDGNGTLQYQSPNIEKWFGWQPEELVGTDGWKTVHPDDLEPIQNEFFMLLEKDNAEKTVEFRYQCKDGCYKWIELTAVNLTHDPIIHGVLMNYHDITERKQRENELHAIATLNSVLRTASVRAKMLPVIAEQLVSLLQCNAVSVEMIDLFADETIVEAAYGVWEPQIGYRQPVNTGLIALILETRRFYCSCNNDFDNTSRLVSPGFFSAGICAIAGAPLFAQDQLIGILWMGRDKEISESEVRLLEAVSDIVANSVQRATLLERTQKFAVDLVHAYDTTLEGWARALELRDQETVGHARNVVELTIDLARAMGFAEDEMKHIRRGALLHDIGKMGIPDSILLKQGPLSKSEWEIMRRHPEYAYQLLVPIEYLRPALDIPYSHHEKWDGSGYPRGLKGEDIPQIARIFAIVDVWDALRSDRPYRKAWPIEKARTYILEQSGYHFDPMVVQVFLEIIEQ